MLVAEQLLWIDLIIKGSVGALFITIPGPLAQVVGLPRVEHYFYARIAGALLLGIATALYMEGAGRGAGQGLGIAGAGGLNLVGSSAMIALTVTVRQAAAARGRWLLWLSAVVLFGLGLMQFLSAAANG